ncbi:hypothetical protein BGZ80_003114 [Entomortierella chlamydospora]|uniref:sn-1-specific diacylglycerol lipase n=1 Tax=Entomortierella chlamydospora TaxID=101097 RepID=A0A9P6SWP2_9FUNG|nr:hypothetical protein BGZ80_003114 [Entomortierella chlamydospora]
MTSTIPSSSAAFSVHALTDSTPQRTLAIATEQGSPISVDRANHNSPTSLINNGRKDYHATRSNIVPEYITIRLTSLICSGQHDKTQVKLKLQNITKHSKPAKSLSDHTSESFDFSTTVHNMTFDTIKIDVYDVKAFNQNKIGRAYLSLRDLQKKVGNAYDNDGDDNTEPEQSVRSSRFDTAAFCKKHDDVFDVELSLYKHGSYSRFAHHRQLLEDISDKDILITKSSKDGKDVTSTYHTKPARSESFAQLTLNGVEVGKIIVNATLHFPDQPHLFANFGQGTDGDSSVAAQTDSQRTAQRPVFQNGRSNTSRSSESTNSLSSISEDQNPPSPKSGKTQAKSAPAPITIPRSGDSGRILLSPSSPPNLSISYGSPISPPLSPTLSQESPTSTVSNFQWLSDGAAPHSSLVSWEESALRHRSTVEGDDEDHDGEIMRSMSHVSKDIVKGEDVTDDDRRNEEELMAEIKAGGSQEKKDMYLNRSNDDNRDGKKGKKNKFSLFPEQTRAAFKDIKDIYSSFFGHGWNLSKSEFWRGIHIVEEYYARHPTPTTNKAFDDIDILEKARHFVRLAIASYGSLPWVYFGYSFKVAPLNRKNVMDYFKLKKEDMIIWHFDKRTALVPSYYIIREPRYNALCIIIRGTFSVTDAMTDLVCEYYPYKDGLVHKGIMDNARFVYENSGKDIEAALKKFNINTIYCIGHSLGAGSASLLCSLLQDHFTGQNLDIKAYLFAPPPICTVNLAVEWERTQIAFINENDIVCRLSYGNALDLKELIKIAAIESLNPAYKDLSNDKKLDRILKVLEKAHETLRAVDDIPRLVTGGTITYLHKVYDDTPVIQNKGPHRSSKFGLPEDWSEDGKNNGRPRRSNSESTQSSARPIARSLSTISSVLHTRSHSVKYPRRDSVSTSSGDRSSTASNSGTKAPIVTPYRPNQPPVRLESSVSLSLTDINERVLESDHSSKPADENSKEAPLSKISSLGEAIHYDGPSNARDLASQRILNDTERDEEPANDTAAAPSTFGEGYETDDEDERKVYTTKKPRKHGSKKKEIRIEFSDREHFMSIPLRTNWLWHHFPQQYDSRIERALAWAKEYKTKEEKKQQRREQRQAAQRE